MQHVGRPLATERTRRPLMCGHDGWRSRCGASDCGCASLRRCFAGAARRLVVLVVTVVVAVVVMVVVVWCGKVR